MNALRLFVGILCGSKTDAFFFFVPPIVFFRGQVFFAEGRFQNRVGTVKGQFNFIFKLKKEKKKKLLWYKI